MRVDIFDFELPPDRIAQAPLAERDAARLLHVGPDGGLADRHVRDLPGLLRPGDLLVLNDTRVIPTRLTGLRHQVGAAPAPLELTLHKPEAGEGPYPAVWRAFARPARKLSPGDRIEIAPGFACAVLSKGRPPEEHGGEVRLGFDLPHVAVVARLKQVGSMPLPPYIHRDAPQPEDNERYQTVYARQDGAVAAPTAGLHLTENLLAALEGKGIARVTVTLHVGAGTFLPVSVNDTKDHVMHSEWAEVTAEAAARINATRAAGGRIVCVGTTALRTVESAASPDGVVQPFAAETDVFFTPGYRFRACNLLLTNFHLPKSTLFMLVSAFSGLDVMQAAYAHAIASGYRFFSYGDACLLEPRA